MYLAIFSIELINPLDYELETSLILFLDAIDGGGEHSRFIINIVIDDMNDMIPHFEHEHYHFIDNNSRTFHSIQNHFPSLLNNDTLYFYYHIL
ncbi:unnamed protein product [Rotaria sp. Silwood1]|nr:unnamed protein product [Rotaria sp. Silwood1]